MSETKQLQIAIPQKEIKQFCRRHHIRKLSLFMVRGLEERIAENVIMLLKGTL
jgi:hypothetical protein